MVLNHCISKVFELFNIRGLFHSKKVKMGVSTLKDVAIIVGAIIALFSFANGILEYIRQGAQKRVEQFVALRRRLKENPAFYEICSLLVYDEIELKAIPAQDKRDFLGLLEEVALLSNSGLIRKDVAH